jgi:plastocyanin
LGSSFDSEGEEMKNSRLSIPGALMAIFFGLWAQASAFAQEATIHVAIENHRFSPAEVHAPANTPITLVVKNLDPTPEEFESKMLRVEKIIAGGGSTTLHIRPLSAGRYRFFGDYHEDTAKGFLVIE